MRFLLARAPKRHLRFKDFESKIRDVIFAIPLVSDVFRYHWKFLSRAGACRGVYSSYAEAEKACLALKRVNYELFNGPQIIGELTLLRKRDYPIMLWLASCLKEESQILDLGGNIGAEYFTYRQFFQFTPDLRWLVWELPYAVEFGEQLARSLKAPGLAFTNRIEDGEGADIAIACGAAQYFEQDLASCLKRLRALPSRLLVNRTPLCEGETFYTIQSTFGSAVPYRVQNLQEFVDSLSGLGYRMVDGWYDQRELVIPFHHARNVRGFYGFYFVSKGLAEPDWRARAIAMAHQVHQQIKYPWSE